MCMFMRAHICSSVSYNLPIVDGIAYGIILVRMEKETIFESVSSIFSHGCAKESHSTAQSVHVELI